MGRRFNLISATIALSMFAWDFSFAQGPPQKSNGRSAGFDRHNNQFRGPGERRGPSERFFQLSPEERNRVRVIVTSVKAIGSSPAELSMVT